MKHLLKQLRRYGIGERPMTEDDFHRICENEGIDIHWSEKKFSFYFSEPIFDIHCIVLPKRRRGLRLLFDMYHELGHHMFASTTSPTAAFNGLTHTKDEAEADAIALIAMIPKSKLKQMAWLDGSRYGAHLYNERLRLFFLYDI